MPTSAIELISPIMEEMMALKPDKILDVGAGNGKWGCLIREYSNYSKHWRDKKTIIDAVEPFADYESCNFGNYDNVYKELPKNYSDYFVLCVDVIEHMTDKVGEEFIEGINKGIVSSPISFHRQGACHGNELERHVSLWGPKRLAKYGEVKSFKICSYVNIK